MKNSKMRAQVDYTRFVAQRTDSRESSQHDGKCQMNDLCRCNLIYIFFWSNETKWYKRDTRGVQEGVQEVVEEAKYNCRGGGK